MKSTPENEGMDQSFAARSAQREKCSKRNETWPAQEKRRSLLAHNQHESVILSEAQELLRRVYKNFLVLGSRVIGFLSRSTIYYQYSANRRHPAAAQPSSQGRRRPVPKEGFPLWQRIDMEWVPDVPDQRDFLFAAPVENLAALPPKMDLRPQCPKEVYDQGQLGSCTRQHNCRRP